MTTAQIILLMVRQLLGLVERALSRDVVDVAEVDEVWSECRSALAQAAAQDAAERRFRGEGGPGG